MILHKVIVPKEDLAKTLVVMAKEYGLTTLQATPCDGTLGRQGYMWIYFETTDETVFRLFKLHYENTGMRWVPPERYEHLNP